MVIDGDVDGSSTIVDEAARRWPVRRITFDENRGRSTALNAGFSDARGEVVVRCDDDLVPGPDYVARHLVAHAASEVGVVGLYRNTFPETTYARVYGRAWDERFRREAYEVRPDQRWRYWAGNVSVTRRTWELVGGYDDSFRAYGWEDVDWGYRLVRAGIPVLLDPALETEHRIAATTTASRTQRAYYSGAARTRFEAKHGPDVLPPAADSTWQRLVSLVAAGLDEGRSQRLGAIVDRAARILPEHTAARAIALAVEAASRAGHRSGTTAGAI